MHVAAGTQDFFLRGEHDLQPLRTKSGDVELHAATGSAFRIDIGRRSPAAVALAMQRHVPARGAARSAAPETVVARGSTSSDAVAISVSGAVTAAPTRSRSYRHTRARFSAAANRYRARSEIRVDGSGRFAPAHAAVGQVEKAGRRRSRKLKSAPVP